MYVTEGRFFYDAWPRAHKAYGVTSERLIIMSGVFVPTSKSLNMHTHADVSQLIRNAQRLTVGPQ